MDNIKYIIESLLFVAEGPLTVDRIKRILIQTETALVKAVFILMRWPADTKSGPARNTPSGSKN
jgi:chromosome segregation and condensation protein ScpB